MKSNVNNDVVFGNHPITITCTSFANPPASRYDFYRDGRHVSTTSSGFLAIVSAKAVDQGIYTCVSSNSIGRGANNATLSVAVFGKYCIIHLLFKRKLCHICNYQLRMPLVQKTNDVLMLLFELAFQSFAYA